VFALTFDTVEGSPVHTVYVWAYFVTAIVVPLAVLAHCNVRLVAALYRSRRMRREHGSLSARRGAQTAGRTVTTTMIAIVLMYAVLVAPGEILTCVTKHLLSTYDWLRPNSVTLSWLQTGPVRG